MFGQLIPAGGGRPIPILKKSVIVGRSSRCDVVVPHSAVSGRHCELKHKDGYWWVTDLDSRNGTGINGVRVRSKRILPNEILCVPRMRFRLVYEAPCEEDNKQDSEESSLALSVLNEPDSAVASSTVAQETGSSNGGSEINVEPRKSSLRRVLPKSQSTPKSPSTTAENKAAKSTPQTARRYLGKLVPRGGGDPIALLETKLVIGRSRDTDIRLNSGSVSSRHCVLTHEEGYWFVEDLGSSNGVRVNGERVERKLLMPGDRLSISSQKFNIDYEPEGPIPMDRSIPTKSLLEKAGLSSVLESDDVPAWISSHEIKDEDAPRKYRLDDNDPD